MSLSKLRKIHQQTIAKFDADNKKHFYDFKKLAIKNYKGHKHPLSSFCESSNCNLCLELSKIASGTKYKTQCGFSDGIKFWTKTEIAHGERCVLLEQIVDYLDSINYSGAMGTIIDLGTGDGSLMIEILNCLVPKYSIKKMRLILIEKEAELLTESILRIKSIYSNFEIKGIANSLEKLDWANLTSTSDILFINASSVLHELPLKSKYDFLKHIRNYCMAFFITEIEALHDIIGSNSNDLIFSAYNFYHLLALEKYKPVDIKGYSAYLRLFLIPELIDLLNNDYSSRRNYHLPLCLWKNIFSETGWQYTCRIKKVEAEGFHSNYFVARLFNT